MARRSRKSIFGKQTSRWLRSLQPRLEPLEERYLLTGVPMLLGDLQTYDPDGSMQFMNPSWTQVGNTVYFGADGTGANSLAPYQLWKTDGTPAGTMQVNEALIDDEATITPTSMEGYHGKLYFAGPGRELWVTDGTPGGTSQVIDLVPGGGAGFNTNSGPDELTVVGDTLFFAARHPTLGYELWKTDGTAAGTEFVADTRPVADDSNRLLRWFTSFNDKLYFVQDDGTHGWELWSSDGTAAGTSMLLDINPTGDAAPAGLRVFDGKLWFSADDGVHGAELWSSDGTAIGTQMVADINPGAASSVTNGFYGFSSMGAGGSLYFSANDGVHGNELWRSAGSAANTTLVKDINPGTANGGGGSLVEFNGQLAFVGNDGVHGGELWKTDGTEANTQLIKDIWPGSQSSYRYMAVANGVLYISVDDGVTGRELWASDGTTAGTFQVADIFPGPNESIPDYLFDFNGTLLFAARDSFGVEPRVIPGLFVDLDGTSAATGSTSVWYDSPTLIAGSTATIDYSGTHLTSLTATLETPLAGDVLAADISGTAIAASFDGTTLTLSGSDTIENYRQVLNTITYDNTVGRPPAVNWQNVLITAFDAIGTARNTAIAKVITNEKPSVDLNGPVVSGTFYSTTWASAPVAIASVSSTLSDADGTNLVGLTVIIANYEGGDDLIVDVSGTNISATYLGGLLTLEGEDTIAAYQQVLHTIKYRHLTFPALTYKTLLVQAIDELGQIGEASTTNISINQLPAISFYDHNQWTGVPLLVMPSAEVTDDANLQSLSVAIESPVAGDMLSVTTTGTGISASFDGTTLLLTGNRVASVYQQVLRTLTYHNTNGSIATQLGHRLTVIATDQWGITNPPKILYLHTPRDPAIDLNGADPGGGFAATWTGSPISITAPTAIFTNPDEAPMTRIRATLNSTRPGDVLTADTTGTGLAANFSAGSLTITGAGTAADYQQVLRTIQYHNTLGSTNLAQYTVDFRATFNSFGGVSQSSALVSTTLTIASASVDLNGAASGTGFDSFWTGNGPTLIASPNAVINGSGVSTLQSLTVTIAAAVAGDVLSATPTGNISVSYNGTNTLTLSGLDSVANYETVLRSVTYDSTDLGYNTLFRTLNVVANNGISPGPTSAAKVTRAINDVLGSKLYYRQSSWNVSNSQFPGNADDNAIAPDKTPYLPGSGAASFANVSSYSRGINGIMIDIAGPTGSLSRTSDFIFKVGNNGDPSTWSTAPLPGLTTRSSAGVGGSKRVQLTWSTGDILGTWLQITVRATAATGLTSDYVLYWGSNPGDTGISNGSLWASVTNTTDELGARNHPSGLTSTSITNEYDFDRNKTVGITDSLIARNNVGMLWKLNLPGLASAFFASAAGGEIASALTTSAASTTPVDAVSPRTLAAAAAQAVPVAVPAAAAADQALGSAPSMAAEDQEDEALESLLDELFPPA